MRQTKNTKEPWQMTQDNVYAKGLHLAANPEQRPAPHNGTFYHVAPAKYKTGDAILSADKLGGVFADKWESDYPGYKFSEDFHAVSLFTDIAEAELFNKDFLDGKGKILEINIDTDAYPQPSRNSEGFYTTGKVEPYEIVGETSHKQLVKQALSKGKPVPPEVLRETKSAGRG